MFSAKFAWDLVIGIIVVLALVKTWDTDKKSGFKLSLTTAVLVIGAVLIAAHHGFRPMNLVPRSQAEVGLSKVDWPEWWQIVIALIAIGYNTLAAVRSFKKQAWLGDKPDRLAGVTSILVGLFWATAIFSIGHLISGVFVILAILAHISICNVQVPEQQLWTPLWFGKRCYHSTFMLGEYCFGSGFKWMLIPRNIPGLTFNVAHPRKGVRLECVTAKVPTKGFVMMGPNGEPVQMVGGEVDVPFVLFLDTHKDLEAFYNSPDEIRNDLVALAAYAAGVYKAEFRKLLKDRNLDEIQTGNLFDGNNFDASRILFDSKTGHGVTDCLVHDATPSEEVQRQINDLAAKRVEVIKKELDAQIALIEAEGVGKARLAVLKPLMDALANPKTSEALKGAVAAVRAVDFAANSQLRVLVEKELGPLGALMPLVAETAED